MPTSNLRFIRHSAEFCEKSDISKIPDNTRGIYALLKHRPELGAKKYDVVYLEMARRGAAGVKGRLWKHSRSKRGRSLDAFFRLRRVAQYYR
jgi:hypothetical protein